MMNNLTVTTDHIFMGNYKNRDNITDDIGKIEEAEAKEKAAKEVLVKHNLRAETLK